MAKTTKKPCRRCWVPTCRNAKPKEAAKKKLFLFPRDVARCREWIKAIGDMTLAKTELRKLNTIRFVCEDHFPPSKITPQTRPAADAVPIIFHPERNPLTEVNLRVFDMQVRMNENDVSDPCIEFTHSNQDSCMSGSSSELSRSSFEFSAQSLDNYYSLGSGDDTPVDLLKSEPSTESDFPWFELSLPSLNTCSVDLSDPSEEHSLSWNCNDNVLSDSEVSAAVASIPTDTNESFSSEEYDVKYVPSTTFQYYSLDSSGIAIH